MSPSNPAPLRMAMADWLLLLLLSLLWGGSYLFAKIAVTELPPFTVALARVALATAVIVVFVRLAGEPLWPSRGWAFAVMGLLNNVIPFTMIVWSQLYIPIGLASILNATTPLFTVLVAHALTSDDKMTPGRIIGLLTGLFGVVVLIGPGLLRGIGAHVVAELACVLAAVSYAFAGVYGRQFRKESPYAVAIGQLVWSSILLLPLALLVDHPWTLPMPSARTLAAMVALAVFSTACAYVIFFRILARAGATNALLVTLLVPVSAVLLGGLVLDEHITLQHVAGMAIIGLGLAAIDGRPARFIARAWRTG
jgi:drug/metabolite transporter (DMT)-like permease